LGQRQPRGCSIRRPRRLLTSHHRRPPGLPWVRETQRPHRRLRLQVEVALNKLAGEASWNTPAEAALLGRVHPSLLVNLHRGLVNAQFVLPAFRGTESPFPSGAQFARSSKSSMWGASENVPLMATSALISFAVAHIAAVRRGRRGNRVSLG